MIYTIADNNKLETNNSYFEQTGVLLKSLYQNSPNTNVSLFLINYPKGEKIIKKLHPKCNIIHKSIQYQCDPIAETTLRKPLFGLELMQKIQAPICYLDSDIIVRKPIDNIFEDMNTNTLKVLKRENTKDDYCIFNSGVWCLGYSKESMDFLNDWYEGILNDNHFPVDQKMMYIAWKKNKSKITHYQLQKTYNDLGCSINPCFFDDSIVWHCKSKHFKEDRYQLEYKRYLKEIK